MHLIGVVGLIGCLVFLPYRKPARLTLGSAPSAPREKFQLTSGCVAAWLLMLIYFIAGQVYSNSISYIIAENGIGTAADAGLAITMFALGGFCMGFFFSRVSAGARNATLGVGMIIGTVAYIIAALAGNLVVLYIGSFVTGLGFSICMPSLMNGAANSVNAASAGIAVAVATCLQNVGQTISPYITNPIGQYFAPRLGLSANQGTMVVFGAVLGVVGIVLLVKGFAKNAKSARLTTA